MLIISAVTQADALSWMSNFTINDERDLSANDYNINTTHLVILHWTDNFIFMVRDILLSRGLQVLWMFSTFIRISYKLPNLF